MKCISLFVCFFIGLQSVSISTYDALITGLENKVEVISEDKASFLSLKCRDVSLELNHEMDTLNKRIQKLNQRVQKLKKEADHKKRLYEFKRLEYSQELVCIQKQNSILMPYRIEKNLNSYLVDYEKVQSVYLDEKQSLDHQTAKLSIYKDYMKRINVCQNRLFQRFSYLSKFKNETDSNVDSIISGSYALPSYGGYETLENNGMSCLVGGNYEIDSYSSFWQNPIENGTISARCWAYPDGSLHLGLDIASAMYSDVKAVANGIVLYAHAPVDSNNGYLGNMCGWPNGGGNTICMVVAVNEKLYAITYAHLSNEIYVTSGQQVSQGTVIAKSGNSGNSTGPHTHVEVFELKQDLNDIVDYFRNSGADFTFGCGFDEPATCSSFACRIDPESVMEGV